MRCQDKLKPSKHALAWLALTAWLVYSLGALWAMEKENVTIGATCFSRQIQTNQDGAKNGYQ